MAFSSSRVWSGTSYAILTVFVASFLVLGFLNRTYIPISHWKSKKKFDFPDFNKILHSRTLTEKEITLSSNDRVIIIGDVHGMNHSLQALLSELSYNQDQDVLMFVGDVVAKSSHAGSLSVLNFLSEHHIATQHKGHEAIYAVRGNHDQLLVQWRSWREWFEKLELPSPPVEDPDAQKGNPGVRNGLDFLNVVEAEWAVEKQRRESDAEEWVEVERKKAEDTWRGEWWKRIPPPGTGKHKQEWRMFGDHYWLARDMTKEHATFLNSLPVVLHIPQHHFFIVHAGLLPFDPRYSPMDPRQPLSHRPVKKYGIEEDHPLSQDLHDDDLSSSNVEAFNDNSRAMLVLADRQQPLSRLSKPTTDEMRTRQEDAILHRIPQNQKWWNLVNMRALRKNGQISRDGDKGRIWTKFWNEQMDECQGFDDLTPNNVDGSKDEPSYKLSCMPSTVVYGHMASRGLEINRWTKGLDSGCVYGHKLNALVLTRPSHKVILPAIDEDSEHDSDIKHIPFGDESSGLDARIVSVKCKVSS